MALFELKKASKIFNENGPNEFRALDKGMTEKSYSELVKFRCNKVGFVFQNFNF